MTFTIDSENNITAVGSDAAIPEETQQFSSHKELAKLTADWPADRLVSIWNSLAGVKPVKKLPSRNVATGRIWKAIQSLAASVGAHAPFRPPTKVRAAKKAAPAKKAPKGEKAGPARDGSKAAKILDLLKRPYGATTRELLKATGWQPHSLRGFLSGTVGKKMGLAVTSSKSEDGERTYSIKP